MNNEQAKNALLELYEQQIMDLTLMSKIELGDDVIAEVKRLKTIISINDKRFANDERYNQIIDKAFSNYLNNYSGNFEVDREEFIAASKRSPDFSQMWGLQFEEKELTYSERYRYWFTHNYETGLEYDEGNIPDFDNTYYEPTPTRLITVTYKDEKIESYE